MTRAETLAKIKADHPTECDCGWNHCDDCDISWLLQEVAHLQSQLTVSRDGRAVLAAEVEYLRLVETRK